MASPNGRRLTRARSGRIFGGVCAGIAAYVGWKPSAVRLLFIVSCVLPGPQFLIYVVMWIVIPRAGG
ncbi:phage shock protein C [Rhodococcus sp. 27YEA15]|uniref:PspC domain-containing protein n=1 Tax=Rhodococcus sp. 27YEA15 TaxID=3156259 RepID=UPI003C7EC20A